jgi:hypothetical protein
MTVLLSALNSVKLGKSVAEKDERLDDTFVETTAFQNVIRNDYDIIEGDKGAGKTALFVRLLSPQAYDQRPSDAIVVRGCNVKGEPFFQQLVVGEALSEEQYVRFWKGYIIARAGNWLLKKNKYSRTSRSSLYKLEQMLRGLQLYSDIASKDDMVDARDIFDRVLKHIGNLFRWKSIGVDVEVTAEGLSFSPKVELATSDPIQKDISIHNALALLSQCLAEMGKSVWVAIDRLDEAFQGFPDAEIPLLRALFRTYRDLDEYENITLKIFVRRDLFAKIMKDGFVNLTHINSSKITLEWEDEDLKTLICNRIRQNSELCELFAICKENNDAVIERVFPSTMTGEAGGESVWPWIMRRICDGNGAKPPRNLIDLVRFAFDQQIKRDSRKVRDVKSLAFIVEEDSLIEAAKKLSEQRLDDTLFAESPQETQAIKLFHGSGAVHNKKSISEVMNCSFQKVDGQIERLVFMGFLQERGSYYSIPYLYRAGLDIVDGYASGVTAEVILANDA